MKTKAKLGIFKQKALTVLTQSVNTPTCFTQAVKSPEWHKTMLDEFNALLQNHTWILVPPLPHQKPVGCKWVFRNKFNSDGSLTRHKARLVTKGYHQQQGFDYNEIFSPVAKPTTIRLFLSLATTHDWPISQLDVSNAFLQGTLNETVYMSQPPGFIDPSKPNYVCKLTKSLYGLKQSLQAWYKSLHDYLLSISFTTSHADHSLFVKQDSHSIANILVYIDDILLTDSSSQSCQNIYTLLQQNFTIKNLSNIRYFLGLKVTRTQRGLFLNQDKYAHDILDKASITNANPSSTPCLPNHKFDKQSSDPLSPGDTHIYRSIVGSLQYLSQTRPFLSFAINQVCQYLHCPRTPRFQAVKRILRYIKATMSHGLVYTKGSNNLTSFCDADWTGSSDDRRFTIGYCIFHGPNLITWSAKK